MTKIDTKTKLIQFIIENTIPLEDIVKKRFDITWDYNSKSFLDMGLDELDIIELVMILEKDYECSISDELCTDLGALTNLHQSNIINPNDLIRSYIRERKLKELGL